MAGAPEPLVSSRRADPKKHEDGEKWASTEDWG